MRIFFFLMFQVKRYTWLGTLDTSAKRNFQPGKWPSTWADRTRAIRPNRIVEKSLYTPQSELLPVYNNDSKTYYMSSSNANSLCKVVPPKKFQKCLPMMKIFVYTINIRRVGGWVSLTCDLSHSEKNRLCATVYARRDRFIIYTVLWLWDTEKKVFRYMRWIFAFWIRESSLTLIMP